MNTSKSLSYLYNRLYCRSIFIFFGNTDFFKFGFKTKFPPLTIEDQLLGFVRDNGPKKLYVHFCNTSSFLLDSILIHKT